MPKPSGFFHPHSPTPVLLGHHLGHGALPALWTGLGVLCAPVVLAVVVTALVVGGDWLLGIGERRRRRAFEVAYGRVVRARRGGVIRG